MKRKKVITLLILLIALLVGVTSLACMDQDDGTDNPHASPALSVPADTQSEKADHSKQVKNGVPAEGTPSNGASQQETPQDVNA